MLSATAWMDLEGIMLSDVKSDRERQILCVFTYMWNLKNKQIEYSKTETDSDRRKTSGYQREEEWRKGQGREGDWEVQTIRYKINKM